MGSSRAVVFINEYIERRSLNKIGITCNIDNKSQLHVQALLECHYNFSRLETEEREKKMKEMASKNKNRRGR